MPTFNYTAYDSSGVKIEAEIEASSLPLARQSLIEQQLHVVTVKEQSQNRRLSQSLFPQKVTVTDLEFLTSELSILLNSGVKIDKGLAILARNQRSEAVDKLVAEILKNLKSGMSVADAFSTKDKAFDTLYLNLIAIGETTGRLPEIFAGLAQDLKFRKDLKAKIVQSLTYPSVILFVCIASILFVFNYIVPQMGSIFTESSEIPVYTALLLGASDWMQRYQWWLFIGIASGVGALMYYKERPEVKTALGEKLLSVPVLSDAIKQIETIRFSSAMSLMLGAGIKVDVAIGHAVRNVKNQVIAKSVRLAHEKIKRGGAIAASLSQTPIFPAFYISLLEVGEESGRLMDIFNEISGRAKQDFESWTTRLTNLLEPLLIIVMGGIVGSVVVTMLLSVVSVNDVSL